jgi:GT2 family glycosyltransferase
VGPVDGKPHRRPEVRGKSVFYGGRQVHLRGVTYGSFRAADESNAFPDPAVVAADFAAMAANGINAVRTYDVPPLWLLDLAAEHELLVLVGLPWEEHVAFLDDPRRPARIEERIRVGVRACAGHPAVLCYAIGNEIPASIVRWYGRRRVERFLERLVRAAKSEDPEALVCYVNYPSTEYLDVPLTDLVCFNVFLEDRSDFDAYLGRLQNLTGDRPLVLTEIGLDSRRNGEPTQAETLGWQIPAAFASGCAGTFVFSWTDEWHRGGYDIDDWDFGLVARDRCPKPALESVHHAYSRLPLPVESSWPAVSVIVCSHNGAGTLRECLEGIGVLDYPSYEVIVVDDGSTDGTAETAAALGIRVIRTENLGLANARNVGLGAAHGEIVAYLDDDAWPDPQWLRHLALAFRRTDHAGMGGPNIPPLDDGPTAASIANAPGGPIHVLLTDQIAEHIPGCNMAFRRDALEAIGGFDPQFRSAGDDVDVCWRLQRAGWTLGFSPGAVVWHRRRGSVEAYLRQQYGYGKAEALLERKWPEKYNRTGHVTWSGKVYGGEAAGTGAARRWRIYYGAWGSGLFQSARERPAGIFAGLALMPEWYLLVATLAAVAFLGFLWRPLFLVLPLLALSVAALLAHAVAGARRASFARRPTSRLRRFGLRALTGSLFLLQPLARLAGRLRLGLSPWRHRRAAGVAFPAPRTMALWSERWQSSVERLRDIEAGLRGAGVATFRGGEFDRWDLQVRGGALGSARLLMAVEEHGGGRQLVRVRVWPRFSIDGLLLAVALVGLSLGAGLDRALAATVVLGLLAALVLVTGVLHCGFATAAVLRKLPGRTQGFDETGDGVLAWPARAAVGIVGGPTLPIGDDAATSGARVLATSIREFTSRGL